MAETGFGNDLRLAREAARISLSGMAKRTGISRSHLGNVETGKRAATPKIVLAYERALGCDVQRRGILSGLAAAVIAPVVAKELIRAGFTAAMDIRPSTEQWEERIIAYGEDYMTQGAAQLQNRLAGDLVVLQQNLESPRMWALAARALTMLGKVSANPDEAVSWYQLANQAADRSEDEETRVWVRGRGALALAYEGANLHVAAQLAIHALAITERPSLGRLNGLLAEAHILGLQGRRREAIVALELAQRVFDIVGSAEQISDFAIPEWRMGVISSLMLARIGAEKRAVAAQDVAKSRLPQQLPRFATHLELHRGLMLVRSGDRAEGIAHAGAAMDRLPKQKHSQSLRLMMEEIQK